VGATARDHNGRFAKEGAAVSADAAHAAKQAELAVLDAVPPKGGTMKLHRIFENRLAELDLDNRDPKTIARNRASFERFTSWLNEHRTCQARSRRRLGKRIAREPTAPWGFIPPSTLHTSARIARSEKVLAPAASTDDEVDP
jgi:hypothetical protein